jgi:uncharacterized membrane protein YfcA
MLAALLLFAAGVAMGFVNNLAGAGGLIALAAFEFAAGLDPTASNAAMRPAAIAIGLAGMFAFASRGLRVPRHVWWWGLATVPGAVLGAVLAIRLPEIVYRVALLVVVLVLVARVLQPRRENAGSARRDHVPEAGTAAPVTPDRRTLIWFTLLGLHMGFLQVGVGLVAIAALSSLHSRDLVTVNAAKMVLVICSATVSTLVLGATGAIPYVPSLTLALGAGCGSFLAGRISVARGHGFVRGAVLAVCAFTLLRLVASFVL